jgi:ABC-type glycerol-3-phosphate transport system substrate-binding protein
MKRTVACFAVLLALLLAGAMSYATAQAEQKGTTAPAKVTTITFWTFLNPTDNAPRNNVQTTLVKEFENENPNIKVDVQVLPWADIAPKLIQAVAADKAPDVSRVAIDTAETLVAAKALMVLDKYTDQLSTAEKEDWLLLWQKGLYGGHKMNFQLEHRADMLWYRKDHLAEIGAGVPKTWDEVGETGGKLTAKGHMGFAVGLSFGGNGNSFTEWFRPAIWGAGGDFTDQDGKAAFNSPAGQRTMQAFYDLVYKYKAIPA